ncbi:MAG: hypothetical protein ACK559_32720, partial [bacterium]
MTAVSRLAQRRSVCRLRTSRLLAPEKNYIVYNVLNLKCFYAIVSCHCHCFFFQTTASLNVSLN